MRRAPPDISAIVFPFSRVLRHLGLLGAMSASVIAAGGCATQTPDDTDSEELATPVPAELLERSDQVVLRVAANSPLDLDLGDTLQETSSEERAKEGSKVALQGGGAVALVGCHPQWGFLWVFTCPAGAVVGAGVAIVGSASAAVYGGTTAWSRGDIDAARIVMDQSRQRTNLANELRDRLTRTLHQTGSTTVIQHKPDYSDFGEPAPDRLSPVVLAIDIDHFIISEVGEVSPDLWIDFQVSGGLYEFPDTRPAYERRWQLNAELGNYYDLVSAGGLELRSKLDTAFDKMALTIVDDLFGTAKATAPSDEDDFDGEVVTAYAVARSSEDAESPQGSTVLNSYLAYRAARDIDVSADPADWETIVPAKKAPLKVGIFPTTFLNGTLPSTTIHEAYLNTALKKFVLEKPTLDLGYDYSARDAAALKNYTRLWSGSAVKKKPDTRQLQRAARQLELDVIMMAWIENGWATTIIDLYVYDVATDQLHEATGPLSLAENLAESAYSLSSTDRQVTCVADSECSYE